MPISIPHSRRAFALLFLLSVSVFAHWELVKTPFTASEMISDNGQLHVVAGDSMYNSFDFGASWSALAAPKYGANPIKFTASGKNILISSKNHIQLSTDNGASWREVSGPSRIWLNGSVIVKNSIFAFTSDSIGVKFSHIWRSDDFGLSWQISDSGITTIYWAFPIYYLGTSGTAYYAATREGDVFYSYDSGHSWTPKHLVLAGGSLSSDASSENGIAFGNNRYEPGGAMASFDNGNTWIDIRLPTIHYSYAMASWAEIPSYAVAMQDTNMFFGTDSGVYMAIKSGESTPINDGLLDNKFITRLAIAGDYLFALSSNWSNTSLKTLWRMPLKEIAIASINVSPRYDKVDGFSCSISRNNSTVKLNITAYISGEYKARVYNSSGTLVYNRTEIIDSTGPHSFSWGIKSTPRGLYYIVIDANSTRQSMPFLIGY